MGTSVEGLSSPTVLLKREEVILVRMESLSGSAGSGRRGLCRVWEVLSSGPLLRSIKNAEHKSGRQR